MPDLDVWMRAPRITTENDIERRRETGASQVLTYCAEARSAPWKVWELPDGTPALEVAFRLLLGEIEVWGAIDQVLIWPDGQLSVRDLKTGNKPVSHIQLGVYALAINEMFGEDIRYGDYWLAKTSEASGMIDLSSYTADYLTAAFAALNRGIEARVFLPNLTDSCRITCGVRDYCREFGGA
ncbi:hypothetical protein Lfu02_17530 [Longispora fulva]|uniref:RecB family exonuclease n=1 Tax=Longispora fulva TaxID=619741 RepID=A0A8J7GVE6_9ACTN|nr:PD-(D/E)XK nuclease family protein [Longispora fulva]MBG6140240.1 RecB family exonuclease [Longispora fulva]GIG57381.1 hypothetical protein Lfu02_17530 [Longispora fulva]